MDPGKKKWPWPQIPLSLSVSAMHFNPNSKFIAAQKTMRKNMRIIAIMLMKRWNGMRVGYSCVAIMASVGVMVVEIGWQGKKQEEL